MTEPQEQTQTDHANSAKPDITPAPETVENPHTPTVRDGPEGYGSLYDDPEFQKEHAEGIAQQIEGWHCDWKPRIDAIMEATGLSRSETMQYLALLQMGAVRGMLQGFQSLWNSESFQAKRQKEHELTLMQHEITAQTLGIKTDTGKIVAPSAAGWRIP